MTSISLFSVINLIESRISQDIIDVSRQLESISDPGFKTLYDHISLCSLNGDSRHLGSCSAPLLLNLTLSLLVIGGKRVSLCHTLPLMVVRSSMQPPSAPLPSPSDLVKNLL